MVRRRAAGSDECHVAGARRRWRLEGADVDLQSLSGTPSLVRANGGCMGQGKGLGQLDLTPYAGSTKTTSCPQGHMLTLWRARPGQCDQCFREVKRGEHVMDCRACDFSCVASAAL